MPRSFNSVMGFPPFRGAVRQIILASAAIYVVILLLLSFAPGTGQPLIALGALSPGGIHHARCGNLSHTYSFMLIPSILPFPY